MISLRELSCHRLLSAIEETVAPNTYPTHTQHSGTVMRSLGQNPTDHELAEMIREADDDDNGKSRDFFTFPILLSVTRATSHRGAA